MAVQTSELRQIKGKLTLWDMRLRVTQSLIWLPRGIVGGLIAALLVEAAARLWPILPRPAVIAIGMGLAIAGGVIALLAVWFWRRNHLMLARRFDRIFGLRERLSTALELSQGVLPVESRTIAQRQLHQAAQLAGRVNAWKHLPLRLDWRWWAGAAIAALVFAGALLIPNPQDRALAQQAEVKAAITQSLTRLEQIKTEIAKDPSLTEAEKQAAIESLDKAIETLKQPNVGQQEALAALNTAEKELKDLSQKSAAERQQALEAASGLFSGTAAQDLADALAKGDLAAAAEALKSLDPSKLTPEEQKQLADALAAAAKELADSNPELAEKLGEAADALKNGDAAKAGEALGEAGDQMEQQAGEGGSGSNPQIDQYGDQVGQSGRGVARAGKEQGSQPGQGGMGQTPGSGQQGGPGSGQGDQPGQPSNGGSGRGEGDGNPDSGGTTGNPLGSGNGPGDGGENFWDSIFSPQRVGGQGGKNVDIPGEPGASVPTGSEGNFANNPGGQSSVPYNQVWANYAAAVNQALQGGNIPPGMRDLIKKYFSNLDPKKKK